MSNTQRIEVLKRRIRELDGLDERVSDLSTVAHETGLSNTNIRLAMLEIENTLLLSRLVALEQQDTPVSTSSSP